MRLRSIQKKDNTSSLPAGIFSCRPGIHVLEKAASYYVTAIRNLVSAPDKLYKAIYFETVFRFAEYCQSMPLNQASEDYSLLIQHLKRCLNALKFRQKYLLPRNAESETIAEQEPQWTYAIFSASLCFQLHQSLQDRRIILRDSSGKSLGQWQPLKDNFYKPDRYFSISWGGISSAITIGEIVDSLIEQIIPAPVMQWLSKNTQLFALWQDAIKEADGGNVLAVILREAMDSITVKKVAPLVENDHVIASAEITTDQPVLNEQMQINPIGMLLDYLTELTQANKKEIYYLRIDHGLLISSNVVNDFIKQNQHYENTSQLINSINSALLQNAGEYYWQYRPKAFEDRRLIEGIVLKEDALSNIWRNQPFNLEFQPAIKL